MNPSELFDVWAPPAATWSRWAKPVLFADVNAVAPSSLAAEPLPRLNVPADPNTVVVVDLPSASSVKAGLALLGAGFRPVPLFNGNRGPQVLDLARSAVVDNNPILEWLTAGAAFLTEHPLHYNAPPAFLLDSRRRPQLTAGPGRFDNRWIVFPQDFPSAAFLKSQGMARAILVQESGLAQPRSDLAHVLLRWQQAGLPLFLSSPEDLSEPQPLLVNRPSHFQALWYRALAMVGLRRNSAGGFGAIVPEPSGAG